MTAAALYALSGIALFGIGFHAVVVHAHRLRKVLAVNIMSSGVFLVLVALASRTPDAAPDPVPHAMVLTGVVVAVSATAVALSLVRRIYGEPGSDNRSENTRDTPP
ncbi:MAG: NADH-quinone oxidoreductase subunit K [Planctomycetota bacterium]|nr:NADH-quinone oxidoreductase subunit K [Planctomycetota bacterium]